MTSIIARAADRAVPKKPKREFRKPIVKGYKLGDELPPRAHKTLMTDAQVLECRRRYEFETGWDRQRLADHYGVGGEYMRALLSYAVRSKLFPRRPGE